MMIFGWKLTCADSIFASSLSVNFILQRTVVPFCPSNVPWDILNGHSSVCPSTSCRCFRRTVHHPYDVDQPSGRRHLCFCLVRASSDLKLTTSTKTTWKSLSFGDFIITLQWHHCFPLYNVTRYSKKEWSKKRIGAFHWPVLCYPLSLVHNTPICSEGILQIPYASHQKANDTLPPQRPIGLKPTEKEPKSKYIKYRQTKYNVK